MRGQPNLSYYCRNRFYSETRETAPNTLIDNVSESGGDLSEDGIFDVNLEEENKMYKFKKPGTTANLIALEN